MRKLLIVMERGLIESVYSDCSDEVEIRQIDSEDEHDDDRFEDYWRNQWLLEHRCYTDIMNMSMSENATSPIYPFDRLSNRQLTSLQGAIGTAAKAEDIAFIDGVLAAWGSLNQYRAALLYSKDPKEKEAGTMLNQLLVPLTDSWENQYDALCDKLWDTHAKEDERATLHERSL